MARPIAWLLPLLVASLPLGAAAGEFVVEPTTIEETKAVFGQVESRDTVPARARIGGTVQRHRGRRGQPRSRPARSSRPSSTTRSPSSRNAADAEIKALQSQLDNARTELDRAQQLLAKRGGDAEPRRPGTDPVERAHQPARRRAGPACRDRAADRPRARCSLPSSGRVLSVPVTKGSVVLSGDVDRADRRRRLFPAPRRCPSGTRPRSRRATTVASAGACCRPTAWPRLRRWPRASWSRSIRRSTMAAFSPTSRSAASATTSSASGRWSGYRSASAASWRSRPPRSGPCTASTMSRIAGGAGDRSDVAVILGEKFAGSDGDRVEILSGLKPGDR